MFVYKDLTKPKNIRNVDAMTNTDTTLSVTQQIELLDRIIENFEYANEHETVYDIDEGIYETADNFVPAYYHQTATEWIEAGRPEPEDYWLDKNSNMPIHELMTVALMETARSYLYQIIDTGDTLEEILTTLRAERQHLGQALGYATLAKAIIE